MKKNIVCLIILLSSAGISWEQQISDPAQRGKEKTEQAAITRGQSLLRVNKFTSPKLRNLPVPMAANPRRKGVHRPETVPFTGKVVFSGSDDKNNSSITSRPEEKQTDQATYKAFFTAPSKASDWGFNHAVSNYADTQQCAQIARDNSNNLFAVYEWRYSGYSEVWCSKSIDGGSTWEDQFALWDNVYNYYRPSIAITEDNQFYIAYQTDDTLGGFQYLHSTDGSKWFQITTGAWQDIMKCQWPEVAVHGTGATAQVLIGWQYDYNNDGSDYDILYAVSADSGTNWYLGWIANSASNERNPAVAITDTCMAVAYELWGNWSTSDSVDIMYRRNNGLTAATDTVWQAAVYGIATTHHDKFPAMAASGRYLYLAGQLPYNTQTDYDIWVRHSIDGGKLLALSEGFEGTTFPPTGWSLAGATSIWSRSTACSGYGTGTASALANFFSVAAGQQDLISLQFSPSVVGDSIRFDHAYATYSGERDSLAIYTSANGGSSWALLVGLGGGTSGPLNTGGTTTSSFVPTSGQWATKKYAVPAGTNKVKFTAISLYGNNLYLDNVRLNTLVIVAGSTYEEKYPAIACADSEAHLTYFYNGNQVRYNNSIDWGCTWTSPAIINDSTYAVQQQSGVDLCLSQGDPRILWTDKRDQGWGFAYDIYFNTSNRGFPHTCDLTQYTLNGWDGPLVPSKKCSVVDGDTVVSDSLRGWGSTARDTTFIRFTCLNNSAVGVADSFYIGIFVDEWWDAIWWAPGLPAGYYFDLLDTTKVFGGRHTLSSQADFENWISYDGDRSNNNYYGQWVWTPYRMPDDTTLILSAAPQPSCSSKGGDYNCDGFRQNTVSYWSVVAVKPDAGGSAELRLYTDGAEGASAGFSKFATESSLGADSVDVVAVDGNVLGSGDTLYPGVYRQAGTMQTDYRIQFCQQDGTAPTTGFGTYKFMAASDLVHTYDALLDSGTTYWAACSLAAGQPGKIGFAVFSPKGTSFKSRNQAMQSFNQIDAPGAQFAFMADTSAWFSLVVWHNTTGKDDTARYFVGLNTTPFTLPLAVTLSSFSAQTFADSIILSWRTESETNSYQWLIERSDGSGQNYALLAKIPAAGTTSEPTNYRWADQSVLPGQIYSYRIGELNTDGQLTYYSPIQAQAVMKSLPAGRLLRPWPNPFSREMAINYQVTVAGLVRIAVYNVAGQLVRTISDGKQAPGIYTAGWDGKDAFGRGAPAGCYFLRLGADGRQTFRKIVKVQ